MICLNPIDRLRECIASAAGLPINAVVASLEVAKEGFGDYTLVLPKAGISKAQAEEAAKTITRCSLVSRAQLSGIYLNIYLNREEFAYTTLENVVGYPDYGICREEKPKRIVVEYVSANPIHPLHIGAARNAALGSFIAKILKSFGNEVQTRFYINDVGRQTAVVALGFKLLGKVELPDNMKPDHFIGLVYAVTSTLADIQSIKKRLATATGEESKRLQEELDQLLADAARLSKIAPDIFTAISEKARDIDFEEEISKIMKSYEAGEPETVKLVRSIVEKCIEGFKETLRRFGAEIEVWDWESDLVWSGEVAKVIEMLKKVATVHKGALAVDFKAIDSPELRARLGIPKNLEVPPLVIMRSDGTTLYTVRDIAYTLKKFREFNADRVINVIAAEQTLAQAQLRLALYMLGFTREAENLLHYSYEMVSMEGVKMSSRRGRIVTLDEVLDEAKRRVLVELEKRGSQSQEVAEKMGVAAVRFYLLSVTPSRPVKFSWSLVLDFEKNSAPYLLYTYARTEGIFRKAREVGIELSWSKLLEIMDRRFAEHERRWRLVKLVAQFPETMLASYRSLDPSTLAVYLLKLADEFNSWYDEEPVITEPKESIRAAKLLLVYAVNRVISTGLQILGIEPLPQI
jgi:arginyl-tRNA synthetase